MGAEFCQRLFLRLLRWSYVLLMWCITLIDLQILKHPCVPGINPTWSWYMILLMGCWIWFVSIWWRISGLWVGVFNHSFNISACDNLFIFSVSSRFSLGRLHLTICPFLLDCPLYWHIIVCSSLLWSFVFLWCLL